MIIIQKDQKNANFTYLKDERVEEEPQKEESEGEIDSNLEMPCTNRRFKTPSYAGIVSAARMYRFHVFCFVWEEESFAARCNIYGVPESEPTDGSRDGP